MPPIRLLTILLLLPICAQAYESDTTEGSGPGQFTFAWPLGEGSLKPRGASTRGVPVTLDAEPSAEWKRLRETGLSDLERDARRDRRAASGT